MTAPVPPPTRAVAGPRGNHRRLIAASVAAVVLLAGGVTAGMVLSGGDKATAQDVALQSRFEPGPDPFTLSVALPPTVPTSVASTSSSTPTPLSVPPPSGASIRSYVGGQPGLYGGTRDRRSCDTALMLEYLDKNPAKKAAWASVQGIPASQVDAYIAGLTSVLLRTDTWVTNHGYSKGHATTRSSVLQAGTAVLVDSYGVPRAKCFCGNPLTPQVRADRTPRYRGIRWAGFNPRTVVVIMRNTAIIKEFVLVDPSTGGAFTRRTDGGPDGDVPGGVAPTTTTTSTTTTSTPTSPPPRPTTTLRPTATVAPTTTTTAPTTTTTPGCANPLSAAGAAAVVRRQTEPFGAWVPDTTGYEPSRDLSAVRGDTPNGTGSSPVQVFLFHKGCYLAPALSSPYINIDISQAASDTVVLHFGHYGPTDPTCCPSLPAYVVRYRWNGTRAVALDPLPPSGQGQ